nr:immunoglobulin light chain junction region [Macaca mulatta]MOX07107.1 immunoglobulin light chain junction region [Macaca mulatta]MOX07120.1 immunoglobulin light chain junction region [Macaca mulatta]MOX07151.1 immunoglobulin light chain junction region [Macaca mulatta]MOX07170.1 immunoglobulin light chain junction region [Macaca mulatta]
CQQGNSDPPTF